MIFLYLFIPSHNVISICLVFVFVVIYQNAFDLVWHIELFKLKYLIFIFNELCYVPKKYCNEISRFWVTPSQKDRCNHTVKAFFNCGNKLIKQKLQYSASNHWFNFGSGWIYCRMPTGSLRDNHNFDIAITFFNCYIKNLIMMQEGGGV